MIASLHRLAEVLCWTLLHSLWEGLAVALIAGLFLVVCRGRSAAFRYNGLVALLLLFLACVGMTAGREWVSVAAAAPGGRVVHLFARAFRAAPPSTLQALAPIREYWASVPRWIDLHSAWCVLLWSLMLCVKCVRLGSDLTKVSRMRRSGTGSVPKAWRRKADLLAHRLGLSRPVQVVESTLVRIPCTLGWLKPLILLPLGMLTQLPPDETESILLHELAHVRRADYLVNLLQGFVDAAFFFNPALLWMSARLLEEREHCCDDLAIGVSGSRDRFVRALVAFQEWSLEGRGAALGFAGRRYALRLRVARILGYRFQILNAMEKSMLTLGLLGAGLCIAVLAHSTEPARMPIARVVAPAPAPYLTTLAAPLPDLRSGPAALRDTVPATQPNEEERQELRERHRVTRERDRDLEEEQLEALEQIREKTREIVEESRKQTEQMREQLEKMRGQELALVEEQRSRMVEQRARMDSMRSVWESRREAMVDFLREKGVLPAGASANSIELRDNELIVNGVKQPDAIYREFKEKFDSGRQNFSPGSEGNSQ